GDHATATALYEQALQLYRELGDRLGTANSIIGTARVSVAQRQYESARSLYREAGRIYRALNITSWADHCDKAIRDLG
ncbi:tetratricopeptide repeat protein, partial [Nocardia rhizosphaerihabitans]|uniref:tetratricopeptide repeat protein n=1 Tax=Nocardia rhizosphaerihabitans TaxID=1691570 RepID=UPI00366C13F6